MADVNQPKLPGWGLLILIEGSICLTVLIMLTYFHVDCSAFRDLAERTPWWCWLWLVLAVYLGVCWLIVGPRACRRMVRDNIVDFWKGETMPLPVVWLLTPLWLLWQGITTPLWVLLYPPEVRGEIPKWAAAHAERQKEEYRRRAAESGDSCPF